MASLLLIILFHIPTGTYSYEIRPMDNCEVVKENISFHPSEEYKWDVQCVTLKP